MELLPLILVPSREGKPNEAVLAGSPLVTNPVTESLTMKDFTAVIELVDEIYRFQPESAVWLTPVYEENNVDGLIKDFQIRYCNQAAVNISEIPADKLVGKCVLSDRIPEMITSQMVFEQCLEAFGNNIPVIYSYTSALGKHLIVCRTKMRGGVLMTARNHTEEYQTKINYQHQSTLFATLIEHSPYGICLYESLRDDNLQIVDFKLKLKNQKAAEITGVDFQDSINKTVNEANSEKSVIKYFDVAREVVETGTPRFLEYFSESRNQWMGFSFVKFEDGYLLNYIDITDIKKYEQEAKRNAHELNTILNGSLHGIYSAEIVRDHTGKTADLKFVRANETFFSMFPETKNILSGNYLSNFSDHGVRDEILNTVNQALAAEKPVTKTVNDINSDRWFELSVMKLDHDMIVMNVNNVTEQQKAAIEIEHTQALLSKSNKDLTRMNSNLESFAYAASHDLQEPLRKIKVFADRLKTHYGEILDVKGADLVSKIVDASNRMMMLIRDLLELSLVNQGLTEWAAVDLNKTVRAALKDLELLVEEANPEINLKTLPTIQGNARQLQQMFYNLFANALKFRKPETRLIVSVSASLVYELDNDPELPQKKRKRFWNICMEDNGIGFDNEDAQRIFKVCARLHLKSEYDGTGIGLSIVQKVVENHHGYIKAEGQRGIGSEFRIHFPVE